MVHNIRLKKKSIDTKHLQYGKHPKRKYVAPFMLYVTEQFFEVFRNSACQQVIKIL